MILNNTFEKEILLSHKYTESIYIPSDITTAIDRIPDCSVLVLHCTGGFRAQEVDGNKWMVTPVLENGITVSKGFVTEKQLKTLIQNAGFSVIAIENIDWLNGNYHSSWYPKFLNEQKDINSPADLWGSISTNLTSKVTDDELNNLKEYNEEQLAEIIDNTTKEKSLASHISFSLCSMDLSIQQIAEYYYEQVVNILNSDNISNLHLGGTFRDKALYTHVHSFFFHLGMARDYLGAFLAQELGMNADKIDDMARLTDKLRDGSFSSSPILQHLKNEGFFVPKLESSGKWEIAGWLKEVSVIRKQFVHKRPYSSKYLESTGKLMPVDKEAGIYRYFRPFISVSGEKDDLLDALTLHYKKCMKLFFEAANLSNLDISMTTITVDDIISMEVKKI